MPSKAKLEKEFCFIECASKTGEIYAPSLMKLEADLESEGKTLTMIASFNWERPVVLWDGTRVYNKNLK